MAEYICALQASYMYILKEPLSGQPLKNILYLKEHHTLPVILVPE
jgi:hypothetical protein